MNKRQVNDRRSTAIKLKLRYNHGRFIYALKAETVAEILETFCPNGEAVSYETLSEYYRTLSKRAEP